MGHFRKIRRPRPSLRRAWDHRRCGTWLFRRMALKRAVHFLSPQNLPKPPKTTQNPPKAFLAPAGQRTKATSNTFFLAFKAPSIYFYCVQACRLPGFKPFKTLQNPPKPPRTHQNPPKAFLARLTPQANAPRPHQQLFLGLQGAITNFLLAFKPAVCQASNPSIPSKTTQNPQELTKTLQRLF